MSDKRYIKSFEYLRGIAFLLIFMSHCSFLTKRMTYWGAFGVSIFIMMSGFLMGYKNSEIVSVRAFTKKRIGKLYPLHIVCMIGALPFAVQELIEVGIEAKTVGKVGVQIVANVTMLQSFVPQISIYFSLNSVAWYLTLVLTFAILTKPLLKLANIIGGKGYWILLGCYLIEIVYTIIWRNSNYMHWAIYINPIFRTIDYFIGIVIGTLIIKNGQKNVHIIMPAILSALALGVSSFFTQENPWGLCAMWTPIAALILICAYHENERKKGATGIISAIGELSMELFLVHQLVIRYMTVIALKLVPNLALKIKIILVPICLMASLLAAYIWRWLIKKFKG